MASAAREKMKGMLGGLGGMSFGVGIMGGAQESQEPPR